MGKKAEKFLLILILKKIFLLINDGNSGNLNKKGKKNKNNICKKTNYII